MLNHKSINFFLILLILVIFIFDYFYRNSSKNFDFELSWDEVNIINAVQKGFFENAFEKNSLNFIKFITIGYDKINNPKNISDISEKTLLNEYTDIDDVFILRNFHPPFLIYYLNFFLDDDTYIQDLKLNLAQNIIGYTILFIIFYFLIYKKDLNFFNKISILFILYIFLNSLLFQSSISRINFHVFFSFILLIYMFNFLNYYNYRTKVNFYKFILCSSLLLISLETSIIIISSSLIILIYDSYKKKNDFYEYFYYFILTIIIFIIIWPANLYNFTLIKTYLMYFYRFFFAFENEYSHLNLYQFLYNFLITNLYLFILILPIVIFCYKKILKNNTYNIYLFFSAIYFLLIIPFAHNITYIFPSLVLLIFYLCNLVSEINYNNKINLILIFIVFLFSGYSYLDNYKNKNYQISPIKSLIKDINNLNINDPKILADGSHIIKYYSDYNNIYNISFYEKYNPKFYIRVKNDFFNLNKIISEGFFDIIIINKLRNYSDNDFVLFRDLKYHNIENNFYHIFYKDY